MDGATRVTRWAELRPAPWRNGGGVTRELVSSPPGVPDFEWRLSIADVTTPGPFSAFPGVDRVITLLEGPSMELTLHGETGDRVRRLAPHEPFVFAGETPVDCVLPAGPTRDLNVMTRRGVVVADVVVREEPAPRPLGEGHQLLVALGATRVRADDGRTWDLKPYDLVESTEPLVAGPGVFALVRLDEADGRAGGTATDTDRRTALADLIRGIPAGQVAAYGQLGKVLGLRPRAVGRYVSGLEDVPWWRVVFADGTPPACHDGEALARLQEEGAPLRGGRVAMREATGWITDRIDDRR